MANQNKLRDVTNQNMMEEPTACAKREARSAKRGKTTLVVKIHISHSESMGMRNQSNEVFAFKAQMKTAISSKIVY